MRKSIFTAILLGCCCSTLFAGAWTQKKGHFYSKLTYIHATSDQRFDFMREEEDFTFNDQALYFYLEYGLFEGSTIVLSTPVLKQSEAYYFSFKGTTEGILSGDMDIQLKQAITTGPIVTSALAGINIPMVYETESTPPLGAGTRNYDLKFLAGASLYPIPLYITGDFGYRFREGEFENEISFNIEAGYTFMNKFLLRALATGLRSTHITEAERSFTQFAFEQEQYRVGTGLIYLLSQNIELDITYLKTTSGRNYPKYDEIYFGIAFKR